MAKNVRLRGDGRPSEAEVDAIIAGLTQLPPCRCRPAPDTWCPEHGHSGAPSEGYVGRHRAEP